MGNFIVPLQLGELTQSYLRMVVSDADPHVGDADHLGFDVVCSRLSCGRCRRVIVSDSNDPLPTQKISDAGFEDDSASSDGDGDADADADGGDADGDGDGDGDVGSDADGVDEA